MQLLLYLINVLMSIGKLLILYQQFLQKVNAKELLIILSKCSIIDTGCQRQRRAKCLDNVAKVKHLEQFICNSLNVFG